MYAFLLNGYIENETKEIGKNPCLLKSTHPLRINPLFHNTQGKCIRWKYEIEHGPHGCTNGLNHS